MPEAGSSELIDPPPVTAIEGCDDSTCTIAQAAKYQHESKGEVTVALYADFSQSEDGDCKIAVLDTAGDTAQVLPLEYVTAWRMRDDGLSDIFHFMDPPTDATGNLFMRIPDHDGFTASGLEPASTGYFELFDLSYITDDFSEVFDTEPMVGVEWGEIDGSGNYTLEVAGQPAEWNGKRYEAG